VVNVEMTLYSSRGWESDSLRRVTDSSGADAMLQFQLEREGDGTNRC
jgi:hypothetical protein